MPHVLRERNEGPERFGSITIIDNGKHIQGYYEGTDTEIVVFKGKGKEEIISEGQIKKFRSFDHGHPATYDTYHPDSEKYPNQTYIPLLRVC
jgi:hypothetical protein